MNKLKKKQQGGPANRLPFSANIMDLIDPPPPKPRLAMYKPQNDFLHIQDNRKVNATSGKKIDPNKDLFTGNYDSGRIDNIIHYAKMYNINPYDLVAMDLQETDLGKRDSTVPNVPGQMLMGDDDFTVPSKVNLNAMPSNQFLRNYGYNDFARAYLTKKNEAINAGMTTEAGQLQYYNGHGSIFPSTEQRSNGHPMKEIYGVPVPQQGIDMKKNPLYGKRIIDLRDNVVKKSPEINDAVETVYQNGGSTSQTGYLATSPDRFRDYNHIPGNMITMDNVPHDILAWSDNGIPKVLPANSGLHKFEGASAVTEMPIRPANGPNYTKTENPDVYLGKYGIPIKRQEFDQSKKNNMDFSTFEDYADWVGGWAKKPGQAAPAYEPVDKSNIGISDKAAGLSNTYYPARDQNKSKSPDTIHSSSGRYQYGGMSNFADMPSYITPFDMPGTDIMAGAAPIINSAAGIAQAQPVTAPPAQDRQQPRPQNQGQPGKQISINPGSEVDALDVLAKFAQTRDRNQAQQRMRNMMTSDLMFPSEGNDMSGNRGDYDPNSGAFRPDRAGSKSPDGMYNGTYYRNGGELPMAMYGTGLIPDAVDTNNLFSDQSAPSYNFDAPVRSTIPRGNLDASVQDQGAPVANVPANQSAESAYNYYVDHYNLPHHVAAGIVGNLVQESSLKPGAVGDKGTSKGIAQWHGERWDDYLKWAEKKGKDPYDVHTQLDYVIVEPGWGDKALKKTMTAQTPQEAAMIFGRSFERPKESAANWNNRVGVAQSLAGGKYSIGGEYEVSDAELKQILKNGGQVEYL
jgi:hypothetical protein